MAVSLVCKNWGWMATSLISLWRDIAFDIAEPESIGLASKFLSLVKDQDVPLHVYADFGPKKLLDPRVANLLGDLRSTTPRWVIFEYQGSLGRYASYLDLPAPNLRHLLGHNGSPRSSNLARLFNGHTPSLRYLLTPSARGWDSAMLSNLSELHLSPPIGSRSLLFSSLFNLLQSTPGLETLRLDWLESIIRDSPAGSFVSLPRLRNLRIFNTNFEALADYISIPNIREATFTIGAPTNPLFRDDDALTALASIPILDQPICEILVVAANTMFEGLFRIRIKTSEGSSFDLHLVWGAGVLPHWKSYISQTLSVLATRVRLDPSVVLHLFLGIYPSCASPSHMDHKIQGRFAQRLLRMLVDDETPSTISIPLVCRLLIDANETALDEDETKMLRLCLRSRAACEVGLFVRLRHGTTPWQSATDYECRDECRSISPSPTIIIPDALLQAVVAITSFNLNFIP